MTLVQKIHNAALLKQFANEHTRAHLLVKQIVNLEIKRTRNIVLTRPSCHSYKRKTFLRITKTNVRSLECQNVRVT
jgi:hypothetical protein